MTFGAAVLLNDIFIILYNIIYTDFVIMCQFATLHYRQLNYIT